MSLRFLLYVLSLLTAVIIWSNDDFARWLGLGFAAQFFIGLAIAVAGVVANGLYWGATLKKEFNLMAALKDVQKRIVDRFK